MLVGVLQGVVFEHEYDLGTPTKRVTMRIRVYLKGALIRARAEDILGWRRVLRGLCSQRGDIDVVRNEEANQASA